jgi:hypothetical protein
VFALGARGVVTCKRCGIQRRCVVTIEGTTPRSVLVDLYRQPARSRTWSTENPGCEA